MKSILFIALLALSAIAATTNKIHLAWDDAPDYGSNVDFHIYVKTNLTDPSWTHWTNVNWIDWTNTFRRVSIPPATEQSLFYSLTASNLFGESDFSDPAEARRLKRGSGFQIGAD